MKRKYLLIPVLFVLVLALAVGCKNVVKIEWLEIKANPATVKLSETRATTISVRMFDGGMNYRVEFQNYTGGSFSETSIHVKGQSECTTQYYPAAFEGTEEKRIDTVRVVAKNLDNEREYTGEVRVTVYK